MNFRKPTCRGLSLSLLVLIEFATAANAQDAASLRQAEDRLNNSQIDATFTSQHYSQSGSIESTDAGELVIKTGTDQRFDSQIIRQNQSRIVQKGDVENLITVDNPHHVIVVDRSPISRMGMTPGSIGWLTSTYTANGFWTGHGLGNLHNFQSHRTANGDVIVTGDTDDGFAVKAVVDPKFDFTAKHIEFHAHNAIIDEWELGKPIRSGNGPYVASESTYRDWNSQGKPQSVGQNTITSIQCVLPSPDDFQMVVPVGWDAIDDRYHVNFKAAERQYSVDELKIKSIYALDQTRKAKQMVDKLTLACLIYGGTGLVVLLLVYFLYKGTSFKNRFSHP